MPIYLQALFVICFCFVRTLINAWYVRQYPPEISYECITRTLPEASRFLLYQLTILPFSVLVSAKNTADSCIFFSSRFRLNRMYWVCLNRKAGILYFNSSPSHFGGGMLPMLPSVSLRLCESAIAVLDSNRLINTVITLNNFIFSIHLMTGNLPLCDYYFSNRHVPSVHLATIGYAHVKQKVRCSVVANNFLFCQIFNYISLLIYDLNLCNLYIAVLVWPWTACICSSRKNY